MVDIGVTVCIIVGVAPGETVVGWPGDMIGIGVAGVAGVIGDITGMGVIGGIAVGAEPGGVIWATAPAVPATAIPAASVNMLNQDFIGNLNSITGSFYPAGVASLGGGPPTAPRSSARSARTFFNSASTLLNSSSPAIGLRLSSASLLMK
jgi:hypothetical protein